MSAKIVSGNLIDAETQYIAHQCNCLTTYGAGAAKAVFDAFPYSDIYKTRDPLDNWRNSRDKPGTIIVKGDGENQRYVINMIAQIFPGKPKFDTGLDCASKRLEYFRICLASILDIPGLVSIGFPYRIGCNLAGGDWSVYQKMVDDFSEHVSGDVIFYKLK